MAAPLLRITAHNLHRKVRAAADSAHLPAPGSRS